MQSCLMALKGKALWSGGKADDRKMMLLSGLLYAAARGALTGGTEAETAVEVSTGLPERERPQLESKEQGLGMRYGATKGEKNDVA